jgi:hypothetical protein
MRGVLEMDKILLKLFKKYFVFEIQKEWKDELKKVDETDLKKWMDDELLSKMDYVAEDLLKEVKEKMKDKWEYELYYDINNFVEDWKDKQKEEVEEETDEWSTDTHIDDGETMLICPDADENCSECDHQKPHLYNSECDTECDISDIRKKCEVWELEEESLEQEVKETGGV